jgi:hypothetical protein
MVALRIPNLPPPSPAITDGFDSRRGGGLSWKLGDNLSVRRGVLGDGGRSLSALKYGDGGPSGWREGDFRGAIIPSEELRLVAGRMRGR